MLTKTKTKSIATFAELKEFVNSLSDEQLEKPVLLWREDECVSDISGMVLNEDHVKCENEDLCYPESEADEDQKSEGLKIAYKKGTPLLTENF